MTAPNRQPQKTIRQLRQERGWSQLEVAVRVGVEQSAVSDWELGRRRPRPRRQQALADLFGISVEAITFGPAEQVSQERP